jgi:hypothetical protein
MKVEMPLIQGYRKTGGMTAIKYLGVVVIISLLFLVYVAIKGNMGVENPSIKELNDHPEAYTGKEISISGILQLGGIIHGGPNIMYLEGAEGSRVAVVLPGNLRDGHWEIGEGDVSPGKMYSISGTYDSHVVCSCQVRLKGDEWTDIFTRDGMVEDCLSGRLMPYGPNVEYRCEPGTISRLYCLHPESIDIL